MVTFTTIVALEQSIILYIDATYKLQLRHYKSSYSLFHPLSQVQPKLDQINATHDFKEIIGTEKHVLALTVNNE